MKSTVRVKNIYTNTVRILGCVSEHFSYHIYLHARNLPIKIDTQELKKNKKQNKQNAEQDVLHRFEDGRNKLTLLLPNVIKNAKMLNSLHNTYPYVSN